MQIQNAYLRVTPPLRTTKYSGVQSRTSLPAQVNPSFSSVERRKRRENHTEEHCLQHNIITLACIVLPVILNMKLGPRVNSSSCTKRHIFMYRDFASVQPLKNSATVRVR